MQAAEHTPVPYRVGLDRHPLPRPLLPDLSVEPFGDKMTGAAPQKKLIYVALTIKRRDRGASEKFSHL